MEMFDKKKIENAEQNAVPETVSDSTINDGFESTNEVDAVVEPIAEADFEDAGVEPAAEADFDNAVVEPIAETDFEDAGVEPVAEADFDDAVSETFFGTTENVMEHSSYIREFSPASGNVCDIESLNKGYDNGFSYEGATSEEAPSPKLIKETVKKSGFKKYVAVAVAAGIVNLAALGGIFFMGYNMGNENAQIASQEQSNEASKQNALATLDKKPQKHGKPDTSGATPTVVQGQELTTVEISKKVGPAVVGITSSIESGASIFGGSAYAEGTGSGIIFTEDGYIVTNNHVIEGAAKVSVTLNTGSEYEAKVVGSDSRTDLAVLKISPKEQLTVAELGDSSSIEVGERAIAIGNPLGMEFFGSTTQGIISAINRTITVDNKTMSVIQTDAAINEGNSGGALVNAYGQVIGINAVKISSSTVEGMGFAIPISEAKPVMKDLIDFGYVKGRPVIGISSRDVTEYMARRQNWPMGVQVMDTQVGSGAEIAGLEQGDIIVKVDGKEVKTVEELNKVKNTHKPGESLELEVYKYETGLKQKVSVKLGEEKPE